MLIFSTFKHEKNRKFYFSGVRLISISLNEHQKLYFHDHSLLSLANTHNLCFEKKKKNSTIFGLNIVIFTAVKMQYIAIY